MKIELQRRIKKTLGEVHFGISPDSDCYVDGIYTVDENNVRKFYKNSTEVIKSILSEQVTTEDVEMVVFSELLFKDIERDYNKYAVKSNR